MTGRYKSLIGALAFLSGVGSLCAYASRSSAATRDCSALSAVSAGAWQQCGGNGYICSTTNVFDSSGNMESGFGSVDCTGSTGTSYGPFPTTPSYSVTTLHDGAGYIWGQSVNCIWPADCWAPSTYNPHNSNATAVWINAKQPSGGTYGNCSWQPFAANGGGCD